MPMPFSPVHSARKFSAVRGTVSAAHPCTPVSVLGTGKLAGTSAQGQIMHGFTHRTTPSQRGQRSVRRWSCRRKPVNARRVIFSPCCVHAEHTIEAEVHITLGLLAPPRRRRDAGAPAKGSAAAAAWQRNSTSSLSFSEIATHHTTYKLTANIAHGCPEIIWQKGPLRACACAAAKHADDDALPLRLPASNISLQ